MNLKSLKNGEKILFNNRKIPLEVVQQEEDRLFVEGPKGGEYVIYPAPDDSNIILVSRKGTRRYASRVEDLRRVGEWKQVEKNRWEHSISEAVVEISENELGHYTISTDNIEIRIDQPKYGFSELEVVKNEIKKIIKDNPEG